MEILGIVGSYRKDGNTDILVKKVLEGAAQNGAQTNCLFLPDFTIGDCRGCEGCKSTFTCVEKDDMQKIYPLIEKADALVVGSPAYFYNVTGIMKNFLDRLYCYEIFDEKDRSVWMGLNEALSVKYAAVVSVCEQANEADMGFTSLAIRKSLESLGYRIVATVEAFKAYSKGDILNQKHSLRKAFSSGEKLVKHIKLSKAVKAKIRAKQ